MPKRTFDKANKDDYDENTVILHNALVKIEKNSKLPATQAQLVKMTGMHRNTIRNREFPLIKLREIKENRKFLESQVKLEKQDSIKSLEEKLIKISKELAYWYGNCRKARRDSNDLERQWNRSEEARAYYEQRMHEEFEKVKVLELENKRLLDIIKEIS